MRRVLAVSGFLAVFVISLGFWLFASHPAYAVTRTWDGGGTDGTCGGSAGDGNKWSCAANWSGDTIPNSSDTVVFDSTSTKNATIDTAFTIDAIQMNTGYTGTITEAADLTLDNSGGFVHGTTDGKFAWTSGTLTFASLGAPAWNVDTGDDQFGNVTINNNGVATTITSGDTTVVLGDLTLTNGLLNTGTADVRGNITQASTFDGGTTIIDFGDNAVNQTFTINGGSGPGIRFDNASDASDSIVWNAASTQSSLTTTAGFSGTIPFSNASNFAITITSWTQAAGTFSGGGFTLSHNTLTISGGTYTAPTTVASVGASPVFDVITTQTFTNLTVGTAAGAFNIGSGDTLVTTGTLTLNASANTGTFSAQGNIVQNNSAGGGTSIIDFATAAAQTYTINGGTGPTLRLDSADDASDSISFAAAGALNQLNVTSGFSGTIPISNGSNFTMTVNTWTQAAGTFSGAGFSNLVLTSLTITGGTFTPPTTVTSTGINPTFDVATTQTFNNLVASASAGSFLTGSGDTLVTTGTLTLNAGLNVGTYSAQGNIVQNGGGGGTGTIDFASASAQTYTINGGTGPTLRLDSSDDASDTIIWAGAGGFSQLNITSGFSGSVGFSNASNFTMTFLTWTQAAGTANLSAFSNMTTTAVAISGGTFNAPGTITTTGINPSFNVNVTQTIQGLTIGVNAGSFLVSAGDTVTTTGTLTFSSGANASGATGILDAQGNVTVGSSWGGGSGPLKFSGSATQTFNLTGATGNYNGDITVAKTGGQVNLGSALVMDAASQDLTIQSGQFNINGNNLTVNGSSGTFVIQNGGTFVFQGAETITANASNPQIQTGSTVEFTGNGNSGSNTYTVTTLSATYSNLTIASTDGATDTFQLGTALDVNGNLSVSAGTFDVTTSNYQINLAGNWSNSGTFNGRSGTVILDGTSQTISGTTTFSTFSKTVSTAATLTFPASATQTFTGTLTLQGASGQLLSLRSSSGGSQATIDPQGSRSVGYLDVMDVNNANVTAIDCSSTCTDSTNNTNWTFPPPPGPASYTGASITLTRLKDPTNTTVNIGYNATNVLSSGTVISVTFPSGWTSFVAPTGGSGLGTSPSFGTFANGFTATCGTGGCATGAISITGGQATTPASPGTYIVTITNNANSDSASVAVAVLDDDTVNVTASVDGYLTFDIDTATSDTNSAAPYTVGLGTLTAGVLTTSNHSSINSIYLDLATNASQGVVVTVRGSNTGLVSTSNLSAITLGSSETTITAGTQAIGICVTAATATAGTLAKGSQYDSTGGSCNATNSGTQAVGRIETTDTQLLTSSNAPVGGGRAEVLVKASIATTTPAATDYNNNLTFIATAQY